MRDQRLRAVFALLCLLVMALLGGCAASSVFYGNRVMSDAGFEMDYTILDHEETAELTLAAGERLQVVFAHERGSVDVTVSLSDHAPIYQGVDQTNAEFALIIPESGDYRISVVGHRAVGQVSFLRAPGP